LAKLLIHLFTAQGYGYFRDEFYYLACANHLDYGYVDQPPLSIYLLYISRALLGDSLLALRFLPAVAGALTVWFTGLITERLGGNRLAILISGISVIAAAVYLSLDHFYSMNAFDILFWTLSAYFLLRALQGPSPLSWILLGLVLGLGLMNKISILWFGAGMLAGLLLTRHRRHLLTPWPYICAAIAFLIFSPYILWQTQHDWATIEFMRNATLNKMAENKPLDFVKEQILQMNPFTFPVWLSGLGYLLFSKARRNEMVLALIYISVFLILISSGSARSEYLSASYTMLYAAGGVFIADFASRKQLAWLPYAVAAVVGLSIIVILPFAIPVLPVEKYIEYQKAFGIEPSTAERKEVGALPQFYADMFGWEEQVAEVARVFKSLPEEERRKAGIFGNNYGQAGAIDLLGKRYGLPRAISNHNNYWIWGPQGFSGEVMIIIGGDAEDHSRSFEEVEQAGMVRCKYCMPYENNKPIYVCRKVKAAPEELWAQIRHYD
jgi:4-amino-4-deoxy-L-arabinose transferase-like glycosyltransferase